jgi:hypothetical protein
MDSWIIIMDFVGYKYAAARTSALQAMLDNNNNAIFYLTS